MAKDCQEEMKNKGNYNTMPAFIKTDHDIVLDSLRSLKRKKSNSSDSLETETKVAKTSKIDNGYLLDDTIKERYRECIDKITYEPLEVCITEKEEPCTMRKGDFFMTMTEKKSQVCITTEQKELGITDNEESSEIVETCDKSDDTDDGSDDTNDKSTDEEKKINRPEAVKFPKLYRLLRDDEDITKGLKSKNPYSNTSVAEHVARGSNGEESRYISTCSTRDSAENLRALKIESRFKKGTKQIVEIGVNRLPLDVKIIDLTEQELREEHEDDDSHINRRFHKFAERFDEVLLEGDVPSRCLVLLT